MRKFFLVYIFLHISLYINAQATDLVVDCQTPGWLSSKINYGDQQTVKNLKVTGYVNTTDLEFIGSLTQNSLNGVIDLSEVTIIGNTWNGSFKILSQSWGSDYTYCLQKLIIPKNLKSYHEPEGETYGVGITTIDTLVFNSMITRIDHQFYRKINHLLLGENIDSINSRLGYHYNINSVYLPKSLKYISNEGFYNLITDLTDTNISEFPSLEYLGDKAFVNNPNSLPKIPSNQATLPDTIRFPQIREFYITAFDYKENMDVFLGENLKYLVYDLDIYAGQTSWQPSLEKVFFHIKSSTPPYLRILASYNGNIFLPYGLTLCIPKGTKHAYEAALPYGSRNYYTLVEEDIPLEQIILNPKEITMDVDETSTIVATLLPECVTDKNIVWSVADNVIASVSQAGEVTALSSGETMVYASSPDGQIQDSCKVIVNAHAESVSIEPASIAMSEVGESQQLSVIVLPDNAVDKSVTWKSYNESICIVSDKGLVTATGIGSTIVTVTTKDGGKSDFCIVKVGGDGIMEIHWNSTDTTPVYDVMGRRVNTLTRGQLYITNGKKFICR